MSQHLPFKGLKFVDTDINEILNISDISNIGYIVEVDLYFPKEIHDKLKEFPPCPENMAPGLNWLSNFQKQLLREKQNDKRKTDKERPLKVSTCGKVVPHLFEHKNYCIHYRNLKFVKDLGVEIGPVHNVISFEQKPWLKEYIDFNTDKRKAAKN